MNRNNLIQISVLLLIKSIEKNKNKYINKVQKLPINTPSLFNNCLQPRRWIIPKKGKTHNKRLAMDLIFESCANLLFSSSCENWSTRITVSLLGFWPAWWLRKTIVTPIEPKLRTKSATPKALLIQGKFMTNPKTIHITHDDIMM